MGNRVVRLVGVYDADGSVRGELAYFFGHLVGRAHCALCDVTHGRLRERADWRACRATLPVPMETFHRDDQPAAVRDAGGGALPIVVAELDDGRVVPLLDRAALEACRADPRLLASAVASAARDRGLAWPASEHRT